MLLYPLWVRIWHLFNAVLIIILILTGAFMQYAGPDNQLFVSFYAGSARLHNLCAIFLTLSYLGFVAGNIISDNGIHYRLRKGLLRDSVIHLKYYIWGVFRGEKLPFTISEDRKFPPLQKVTYLLIMYAAMPLLILSGLIMLFPDMAVIQKAGLKFYVFTDILHIVTGFVISLFLVIHIYVCTIGPKPGSVFRSIMSGYREIDAGTPS